jgi:hypothetical protein
MTMINTRGIASRATLSLLLLLAACGSDPKPRFSQEVAVSQYLPSPTQTPWQDQTPVNTPVKVGPDSLPVVVNWTTAKRDADRAVSRVSVDFPEHPASDSLSAAIFGPPINHGSRDAILQGLTLHVVHHRDGGAVPTIVHLTGDGTARLD